MKAGPDLKRPRLQYEQPHNHTLQNSTNDLESTGTATSSNLYSDQASRLRDQILPSTPYTNPGSALDAVTASHIYPVSAPHPSPAAQHGVRFSPQDSSTGVTSSLQQYQSEYSLGETTPTMSFPVQADHAIPLPCSVPTIVGAFVPQESGSVPVSYGTGFTGPAPAGAGAVTYSAQTYSGSINAPGLRPKKVLRATQACDSCRTRKARCDEGRPRCSTCIEQQLSCNYQSIAPPKLDRANQALMDQIEGSRKETRQWQERADKYFEKLERALEVMKRSASIKQSSNPELGPVCTDQNPPTSEAPSSRAADIRLNDTCPREVTSIFPHVQGNYPTGREDGISAEHNTASQKLLRWSSIKSLLEQCEGLEYSDDLENYVHEMELYKGPLRIYGRGQGPDIGNLHQFSFCHGPLSPRAPLYYDEPHEQDGHGFAQESQWGFGINPWINNSDDMECNTGGLCSDNCLKLDSWTVLSLYQSYLQNMHILHPFIDDEGLNVTISMFQKRYVDVNLRQSSESVDASAGATSQSARSRTTLHAATNKVRWSTNMSQHITLDRSPATALVLLILALGKICKWQEPLPGSLESSNPCDTDSSNLSQSTRTARQTMKSTTLPHAMPSVNHSILGSREPSKARRPQKERYSAQRNVDIIPGLAYYAFATEILGNLSGSHHITYVQCCLLAGLYAGQLANTLESLTWIQCAARCCCILTRSPFLETQPSRQQNSIRLAFYTALQLENDILSELDIPGSGIKDIEGVAYPNGFLPENMQPSPQTIQTRSLVMQFYSYQLHLRNMIDKTQVELYGQGKDFADILNRPTLLCFLHNWLVNDWRSMLPDEITCTDDDFVPRDINSARLREKYFSAMFIIHRPMIHYALELENEGRLEPYMRDYDEKYSTYRYHEDRAHFFNSHLKMLDRMAAAKAADASCELYSYEIRILAPGDKGPGIKISNGPTPLVTSPIGPPSSAPISIFQKVVLNSARTAVQAAIKSTLAYDGLLVTKRLIVTNIFGTAHAQFGNMLVLSAVYMSRHLQQFIGPRPKKTMTHLFKRTITFLAQLQSISETLSYDLYILRRLEKVVLDGETSGLRVLRKEANAGSSRGARSPPSTAGMTQAC